jgi:carboxyl-terminal processing protease
MRNSRFLPVALLAVVLSALIGGFYGSVLARQDEVTQQYRVFTAALAAIDREYVEEVPSDRLVYGGVEGMLKTLDPHSSFFDPRQYAQMRERQEGRYYGLGITIAVVTARSRWSPSLKARQRIRRAFAAATSSARSRARRPRAGRAKRRSVV